MAPSLPAVNRRSKSGGSGDRTLSSSPGETASWRTAITARMLDRVWTVHPLARADQLGEVVQGEGLAASGTGMQEMPADLRRQLRREILGLAPGEAFGQRLEHDTGGTLGVPTRAEAGPLLHLANKLVVRHYRLLQSRQWADGYDHSVHCLLSEAEG